ncbi:AAA family ATPase [Endozoicomonas sp.]|uniref:AAA family ATPase n=1 Tax=Endozoicomonas sp. TaxID=1892382 RepID=UPI003AF9C3C2
MKYPRNPLIFIIIFSITIFNSMNVSADGGIDNWAQIKAIRNYLSENQFFENLDFSKEDSFQSSTVQEQIETGRAATQKALAQMSSYYAIESLGRHGLFIGTPGVILAGTALSFPAIAPFIGIAAAGMGSIGIIVVSSAAGQVYYTFKPPRLPEADLIIEYGAKRHLFDNATRTYIEQSLFYRFWQTEHPEQYDKLIKVMDKALRMPLYAKRLSYHPEIVTDRLHHFSSSLTERLQQFVFSEITYQRMKTKLDIHYPVYFQGEPGTGKTFAAKNIANAMGTNLATVTLDGASIEDIVGTSFDSLDAKPGRILEAMIANTDSIQGLNHHNQVLLIDEFDRLLVNDDKSSQDVIAFFLKILDPNHRFFYSPYLKAYVHLPDTIILAGNSDIQERSHQQAQLQAMSSRLDHIIFDGFSTDTKLEMALHHLIPKMEKSYQSIDESLEQFSLEASDLERIEQFIAEDNDPGLRSLEKFISWLFERKMHSLGLAEFKNAAGG